MSCGFCIYFPSLHFLKLFFISYSGLESFSSEREISDIFRNSLPYDKIAFEVRFFKETHNFSSYFNKHINFFPSLVSMLQVLRSVSVFLCSPNSNQKIKTLVVCYYKIFRMHLWAIFNLKRLVSPEISPATDKLFLKNNKIGLRLLLKSIC